ncbi:MAG: hypothetical protein EBT10_06750, partial [Methylocystaceae bacterium]|nr:hypothetical protein [Methylocystaceae bacterium]
VEDLTETRSLYHSSIFQASLAWQTQGGASLDLVDLEIEPIAVGLHESKFDVTLYLTPQTNGSISGLLEYDASLFAERTASSWICQFERLCEAFSSQSHAPLASLSLIDAHERTQVISTFNDTQKDIPTTTLPELFAAQVEKTPEAIALIFGEEEVSYRELDARANQLARYLIEQNIGPEDIVAIGLDRSIEMVVSLLGVLKSGAAYLPLDPEYPAERLAFMLVDSAARCLITTQQIYDRLSGETAESATAAASRQGLNREQTVSLHQDTETSSVISATVDTLPTALLLDDAVLQAELATLSSAPISNNDRVRVLTPQNLAYLIYTSGTSGKPKAVANTHVGAVNLVSQADHFWIIETSQILQLASQAFDAAFWEWGSALINGASLNIPRVVDNKIDSDVL